jgi:NAD(P)-dependent dehydrogenase (short-subunit alcohol dehydrogenase family)
MSIPARGFGPHLPAETSGTNPSSKAAKDEHTMDLCGKVAVITGGKRIGRVVAKELAAKGMNLVLSYRGSKDEAEQTAADVEAAGRRAAIVSGDVSKPEDCVAIIDHAVATFGRVDVLVNMASIYRSRPLPEISVDYWTTDLDVNLRSAFLCAHAAIPHMRMTGGGRIVNFADWLVRSGRPRYTGFTPYYVAKAGVVALTESMALEVARDNILVNAVAPGPIVPPPDMSREEADEVARATPVGHWGGETEIAKAVVLLCQTDFITGETIRVDGGRHLE